MLLRRIALALTLSFTASPAFATPPDPHHLEETPPPEEAPHPNEAPHPEEAPPKSAKDKLHGAFVQDFSGEVRESFLADAKKRFIKEHDDRKQNAAMEKAMMAVADVTLDLTADHMAWAVKHKTTHDVSYVVTGKDDPMNVTLMLMKDGKKDLHGVELAVTFHDDDTFELKDPFAPRNAMVLVFKRVR